MVSGFEGMLELIYSELCQAIVKCGRMMEVQIYRLENRSMWRLEVVNDYGSSTLWNRSFATDFEALKAFNEKLRIDGPLVFLDAKDDCLPLRS